MKYSLEEHKSKQLITSFNLTESVGIAVKINRDTVEKLTESAKGKSSRKLIVQMEAIHVGRTANYTFYTEEGLKNGLSSWTSPYNKPVLTHHNSHSGEAIGRILKAEYAESTMSGRKGLIFTCEITDPDAIEKVLDGRYTTVSIGATTDKVTCNICGTDRSKEWCEHWRGDEYEGQTCHYIIGTTFGREVSYVNVPADENAGNFSVSVVDEGNTNESATLQVFQIAEGLMQNINLPDINLYESASEDVRQLVDGLLKIQEGGTPVANTPGNTQTTESELQTKLNEATNRITTLEGQLTEAQRTLATITVEKTKVDGLLSESQAEVERLTNENADLLSKAHKALAEKVVEMKLSMRKPDVVGVTREAAVEEHIKRTEESLQDLVKDLALEMQQTPAVVGTLPNPGITNEGDTSASSQQGAGGQTTMTVDEAVGMFKGMFKRKTR